MQKLRTMTWRARECFCLLVFERHELLHDTYFSLKAGTPKQNRWTEVQEIFEPKLFYISVLLKLELFVSSEIFFQHNILGVRQVVTHSH